MPVRVETVASLDAATRALQADRGARLFGGGTLLMRAVNEADPSVATLIRVTDPDLHQIRNEGARITIGAGVTMAQVLANRDLSALHAPARAVGGPAVRHAATIGGNLFAPPPYGEFATALLALGATVHMAGPSGASIPIDDLLRDRDRSRVVRAVSVPRIGDERAFRFVKVSRTKPKGVAVMSIAVHWSGSGDVRVAYGNMGPTPVRASAVERALRGARLDAAGIAPALAVATEGLDPPSDALSSEWYRREVAPVHLRRLLLGEGR